MMHWRDEGGDFMGGKEPSLPATQREALVRRARPDEAEALTELKMRSKAYWGYDQAFLDAWRPGHTITAETIARDEVYCAEIGGTVAGMCRLYRESETEAYLEDLFVEPAFIGAGIGGLLWRYAVQVAERMGATALDLVADPYARSFYEHVGAAVVGEIPSSYQGRPTAPRMRYELPARGK